ncbi:uncharacterized protein LOC141899386 isoform X2 [Tubulanus polymorphus]|uniref:uncharacterized protein LOC141899386 isoform X2 n=1 Tax=Tubulanus polymorphus TaxID=672921 RepID=UPI003DA3CF0C
MNRSSHHMERPRSELLVDLHVYIVPRELWVDRLHCALNQVIEETVSAGFVRVLPETRVHDLREDIEKQLGYEVVPKNYVFLKSVGRCLTRVKAKQEYQMKIKHFLPPHAYCPEIFLLDPPATMRGMSSTDDDSLRNSITPYNKSKEPEPKPVRAKSQTPRPVEPERDEIGSSSSAELRTPHLLENSDTNDDDNFINNNKNNDDNGTRSGSPASARRQTASGTPMSATPCGSRTSFYFDLLTRKIPTADTSSRRAKYSQETKDSGIAEDSYSDRQRQLDRNVAFKSIPLDQKITLSGNEEPDPIINILDTKTDDSLQNRDIVRVAKDIDTDSDDLMYERPSRPKRKLKSTRNRIKSDDLRIETKPDDTVTINDLVEDSILELRVPPNSANISPALSNNNCSTIHEEDTKVSLDSNDRNSQSSSLHDQIKDALLSYDGMLGVSPNLGTTVRPGPEEAQDEFQPSSTALKDSESNGDAKNHPNSRSPKRLTDEEINIILEKPIFKDLPQPKDATIIPSVNVSATNSENGADDVELDNLTFPTLKPRLMDSNKNNNSTQTSKSEFVAPNVNATSSENGADDMVSDSRKPLAVDYKKPVRKIERQNDQKNDEDSLDGAVSAVHSDNDDNDGSPDSRPGTYTLNNPRTNTMKSRRKPEKIQQKKPKPRVHIAPPPKPAESPKPPSRQSTPPAPSQQRQRTLTPYKPDPTDEDRWAEHSDDAEPQEEPEEEADEELEEEEDDFDELEGEGRDSENRRKLEEERRRREEERRRREEERRRQKEEDDRRRRQELEDEERRRRQEQEDWENVQRQEEDDRRRREELERKRREEEDERRLKEEKERRLREEEERKKAAAKNKDDERRQLMEELEQIQKDRKEMEAKREELVRRAKLLQSKTQTKRNQARDVWKKKYFEEKKKTPALEDKCNKLRIELESLHRKIVGQMETGPVKEKHSIKPVEKGGKPSQAANLRIQATKLQHEVEEMQRRVDDSKMKLTAEVKVSTAIKSDAELKKRIARL